MKMNIKKIFSVLLIPATVAGTVSMVSFGEQESRIPASSLYVEANGVLKTEGELALEFMEENWEGLVQARRGGVGEAVAGLTRVCSWIDDNVLSDSDVSWIPPSQRLEIRDDSGFRCWIFWKTTSETGELGDGDSVEWMIGKIPGLGSSRQTRSEVRLGEVLIAYATFDYQPDGSLFVSLDFTDNMRVYNNVSIGLTYTTSFQAVRRPRTVQIQMYGWGGAMEAVIVPAVEETTRPSETETTEIETEASTEETTTETTEESSEQVEEESTTEQVEEESTTGKVEEESTIATESTAVKPASGGSGRPSRILNTNGGPGKKKTESTQEQTLQIETPSSFVEETMADTGFKTTETKEAAVKKEPIKVAVQTELQDSKKEALSAGDQITYSYSFYNSENTPVQNLSIRSYLPEHTSFVSLEGDGKYGVINGRQHVTWNIDSVAPGQQVTVRLSVNVFPCTPKEYSLKNSVYYQLDNKMPVNNPVDPKQVMHVSDIPIR